ncbi:MAG: GNAT family N-acetyltransferase [Chloroflexota bacterium]
MTAAHADSALAARVEAVLVETNIRYVLAYERLFPNEGAGYAHVGGGAVTFAGVGSPLSRASGLGFDRPVQPTDLDLAEQFLVRRGAVPRVDLCPFADGSLGALLAERGYVESHTLNINVLPLSEPLTAAMDTGAGAASLELIALQNDSASAAVWADTVAAGFADHGPASPADRRIYLSTFAGARCWLGLIAGRPVGGGALRLVGKTALLSTASTVPEHRRRGVQSALMLARLAAAQEAGCDLAVVLTTPDSDSERNVRRFGFEAAYADTYMRRE